MRVNLGINTFHVVDRYGLDEQGEYSPQNLARSVESIVREMDLRIIELFLDAGSQRPDLMGDGALRRLKELKEAENIRFSAHLPFKYLDLSSLNEGVRKLSMECCKRAIDFGEELDVDTYVVHLTGAEVRCLYADWSPSSPYVLNKLLEETIMNAHKSLEELTRYVDPRRLCVENLYPADFSDFECVVQELGTSVCFDVGHLLLHKKNPIAFLDDFADRIRVIHLHDVSMIPVESGKVVRIDHQTLGTGELDLSRFLKKLEGIQFDGYLILEPLNGSVGRKSLEVLRQHITKI